MSELTLEIKSEDEICLPDWIAASSLSLAEIGAVACLACIPSWAGGYQKEMLERINSADMTSAMRSLEEKGVFKGDISGKRLQMSVDLDLIAPDEPK